VRSRLAVGSTPGLAAGLYNQNWYCMLVPPVAKAVNVMGVVEYCGEAGEAVTETAVSGVPASTVYQRVVFHGCARNVLRGDRKQIAAADGRRPRASGLGGVGLLLAPRRVGSRIVEPELILYGRAASG